MSLLDWNLSDVSLGGGGSYNGAADSSAFTLGNVQEASESSQGFSWSNAGNFISGLIDKGTSAYNTIKTTNASTAYGASATGRPEAYAYNGYANRDILAGGGGGNLLPLVALAGLLLVGVLLIERKG